MNKNKITNSLLIASFLSLLFIYGCSKNEANQTEKQTIKTDTIPVQVAKVELKDINMTKIYSGTLEGEEQANIISKIPERIISIKAKIGEYVKAGQVVVLLDKSGASSQYFQAEAVYLNSKKDLERMQALHNEGAISQQMLDGARTQFEVAKANFEAAKSTVELTAPISGIVTSLNVSVGDLAPVGMPMLTIANISRMKAIISVGEMDMPNLVTGQLVEVYSDLRPELVVNGRITEIFKSANIDSRSFDIKSIFCNTNDKWFRPGMFCKVKIGLKTLKNSLSIPSNSIISNADEKGVYVIENGKAVYRKIQIGIDDGKISQIINGLKEGETIVTLGMNNLKDGSLVHIAN